MLLLLEVTATANIHPSSNSNSNPNPNPNPKPHPNSDQVIATANKTARRVMAALEAWRHTEAFPMKVVSEQLVSR